MVFLVCVVVLLACSYAGAAIHAKMLLSKGESKSDVETKITNTGASIMVLGVILTLVLWPPGKPWFKNELFGPIYKLSCKYIKTDPKSIPKGQMAEAEKMNAIIRKILIGSIVSILCGVVAQVIIKSQAGSLAEGGGGSSVPKGPRSPWSGQNY